jgi:hypothetical protein
MAGEKRTEERPPIFHLRTLPQSVKMIKFPVPADFRGKKHEHSVFFARYRLFFPNLLNLFFIVLNSFHIVIHHHSLLLPLFPSCAWVNVANFFLSIPLK